jgi:DMSO/TMAO reductase YedYZ molybdopterin-dependent catalytic subunit
MRRPDLILSCVAVLASLMLVSCQSDEPDTPPAPPGEFGTEFPPFITPVEDDVRIRIGEVPEIQGELYRLKINGMVDAPGEFSLDELTALPMLERTVTMECIGNPNNGSLVSTATWKGFRVYDLIASLGIAPGASVVRYTCADGYYTYNTLEELKQSDVLAGLYINGEAVPADLGYPFRIVFPGYYGVRQPGWIVEMEVLGGEPDDYWSERNWSTEARMAIDSRILFPGTTATVYKGDTLEIGGLAYGTRRVDHVDITVDNGTTWVRAEMYDSLDADFTWVFWKSEWVVPETGSLTIRARATARDGSIQPMEDDDYLDGSNAQPVVSVQVRERP